MRSTVTKRGQTVVPAEIRKRHRIGAGDRLVRLDDGETIRVVPIPADPVRALRGSARGEGLSAALMESRRQDRIGEQ